MEDDDTGNPNVRRVQVPFGIASKSGLTAPNYNAQALQPLYAAINDLSQTVLNALGNRRLRGVSTTSTRRLEVINVGNGITSIQSQGKSDFILLFFRSILFRMSHFYAL